MTEPKTKLLFLCTGNSARSIFAEFLTRKICPDRFEVYSAGSQPAGAVNPYTLKVLRESYKIDPKSARRSHGTSLEVRPSTSSLPFATARRNPVRSFPASQRSLTGASPILRKRQVRK